CNGKCLFRDRFEPEMSPALVQEMLRTKTRLKSTDADDRTPSSSLGVFEFLFGLQFIPLKMVGPREVRHRLRQNMTNINLDRELDRQMSHVGALLEVFAR